MLAIVMVTSVACTQMGNNRRIGLRNDGRAVKGVESSIARDGEVKNVRVVADNTNVRTGCSSNTPVLQTTDRNTVFDVVSKVADWYAIRLSNNKIGFVPGNKVKPIVVENKKPGTTPGTAGTLPGGAAGTSPETGPQTTPGGQMNTQNPKPQIPDTGKANSTGLTTDEKEMLSLINEARAQNNVSPLSADIELTKVARIKAQDMIDNNYFSHNSPTYGSPFDMMKQFGIQYVKAGENIAGNQTVQKAHNALMNSPGHRKNILSPDYTHIGLGIRKGGSYGNMFSQMFISKPK